MLFSEALKPPSTGCHRAEIDFRKFSREVIIFTSRNKTLETFHPPKDSISYLSELPKLVFYNEKLGGKY